MKKEYRNRYNTLFTFEVNTQGNIDWKGDFQYLRLMSTPNTTGIYAVDPSGGPFIKIGDDMSYYGIDGIVSSFINHKEYFEIIVKNENFIISSNSNSDSI